MQLVFNHMQRILNTCHRIPETSFFAKHTSKDLVNELMEMDWTSDENKQLKKLISSDDATSVDCEIEGQLYVMIKIMKQKQQVEQALVEAKEPKALPTTTWADISLYYTSDDSG